MLSITKEFTFDAAHRLMYHKGKCCNIHGHRFKLFVEIFNSKPMDESGMIVDFGILNQVIKTWLDDNLDHSLILNAKDSELIDFVENHNMKYFILQREPTVENIIEILNVRIQKLIDKINNDSESISNDELDHITKRLYVKSIKLYETEKSYCTYKPFNEI